MNSSSGGRMHELFQRALDLPAEQREAFIELECEGDPDLAGTLRDLLANDHSMDDQFLEGDSQSPPAIPGTAATPERIGPYLVVREVGRGGMGIVYEAQQENPKRRVAVKIVRSGFLNAALVSRFRREAHVLAQLQHRGIAHIYESGSAAIGTDEVPYFAMEFIDGLPLDKHADRNKLSVRQRLELIARVCDAVQHAHQKGIIHRDLKPNNVLVVEEQTGTSRLDDSGTIIDAIGQPKILDFGIARFTDANMQATVQTSTGQIIGTLAYMSPEQVEGRPDELDTRCDVYALGVMLYTLMAGHPPHELAGLPVAEAARIIKEDEPQSLGAIDASLRGDIATIARKAMDKDRERRYASAGMLADDIRRHLRDEPISARPASTLYQLGKFTRRNKALVGGIAATMLALAAGLVITILLLGSTTRERDAKQLALDESNDVTEFFSEMLTSTSPDIGNKDMSVREMLDQTAKTIGDRFGDRPLLEARIRRTMGETYVSLGEFDEAAVELQSAIDLMEKAPDSLPANLLGARVKLGEVHALNADYDTAFSVLDAALADAPDTPELELPRARAVVARAATLSRLGQLDEAQQQLEAIEKQLTKQHDPANETLLAAKAELALIALTRGDVRAEAMYEELIAIAITAFGDEHPRTLGYTGNLGAFLRDQGRNADAVPVFRQVYQGQSKVLGPAHRQTLISANNLAQVLARSGEIEEAKSVLNEAIEVSNREHGEDSATALFLMYTLGGVLHQAGELDEAERAMVRSVEAHRRIQGPEAEGTFHAERNLLGLYYAQEEFDRAIEFGEVLVERVAAIYPEDHPRVFQSRFDLAKAYLGAERLADAEALLLLTHPHASPRWQAAIEKRLVTLYEQLNKPNEAAQWRKESTPETAAATK